MLKNAALPVKAGLVGFLFLALQVPLHFAPPLLFEEGNEIKKAAWRPPFEFQLSLSSS